MSMSICEAADDRHACPTLPSRASPWFNAASFWSSQKAGAAIVGSTIPELPSFKTAKPAFSFLQQLHWSSCGLRCPGSGRGVINFIFCHCFVFPSSSSFDCHTQMTNIKWYNICQPHNESYWFVLFCRMYKIKVVNTTLEGIQRFFTVVEHDLHSALGEQW